MKSSHADTAYSCRHLPVRELAAHAIEFPPDVHADHPVCAFLRRTSQKVPRSKRLAQCGGRISIRELVPVLIRPKISIRLHRAVSTAFLCRIGGPEGLRNDHFCFLFALVLPAALLWRDISIADVDGRKGGERHVRSRSFLGRTGDELLPPDTAVCGGTLAISVGIVSKLALVQDGLQAGAHTPCIALLAYLSPMFVDDASEKIPRESMSLPISTESD